ncbi:hypothetical protein Bca101_018694 [Brassica carinata]
MFNYFCAQMMRNKVTADLSSNGSSSSFSSFSAVQAVSVEKSTKNVSVEKGMRAAPWHEKMLRARYVRIVSLSQDVSNCYSDFLLWSHDCSKEEAHDSMVYSYRHGFTDFAAKLIDSQAKRRWQVLTVPEVVHVTPDSFYQLATTRTWDYLGLSAANAKNLLNETNMGEQSIIGIVDKGGNSGPEAQTVTNTAPWILTVVATTLDRSFPTPITLGKDREILGQAMYTGPKLGFNSLDYPENPGNNSESFRCISSVSNAARDLKRGGGLGVIIARQPGYLRPCLDDFPCVTDMWTTSLETIYFFTYVPIYPVVKIQPSRTLTGQPVATKMATFSSRGPNSIAARSSK